MGGRQGLDFKDKGVLITGGAGFLGSYLTEEMLKQGARVTVYDRFSQGKTRIIHVLDHPSLEMIEADLLDYPKLVNAVRGKDFIWHLAGNTDIPSGMKNTALDLDDGLIATRNVLEAMRETGVRKIVFPSSGAVYGEKTQGFRSEKQGPTLPISLYGAGKVACEAFISAYAHLFGIQVWIFRYGNIISGRITHGVILDFIRKLRTNPKQLEVLGDGTQTKSYLLTEECIGGMLHVINHTPLKEGEEFCDVFNLGAADETVVLDVAKIVIEEMGLCDCEIKIKGGKRGWPGDQAKIALDGSKVCAMGWKPKHTSDEAVRIAVRRMLEQKDLIIPGPTGSSKISIIGLWHLGLVSAALLADLSYPVVGYDPRPELLRDLKEGKLPLYEPGLEELVKKHRQTGQLCFAENYKEAVSDAQTVLITYDTPVDDQDQVDLTLLEESLQAILPYLIPGALLIINSQVPVGSCEGWQRMIDQRRPDTEIDVICSPENIRLGQSIQLFRQPDMMIIGSNGERARKKAERFYGPFRTEKFYVSWRTAEMAKHALNVFFATSISFANELGTLCDAVGADGRTIAQILKKDGRIGKKAQVIPGLGFAGATLARDLRALQKLGRDAGVPTPLFDSVLEVNQRQIHRLVESLEQYFEGGLVRKTITVLGLTYKPGTSTLRRSASIELIRLLQAKGAQVRAHDPKADLSGLKDSLSFEFFRDLHEAVEGSHGIVVMTEWPEYKDLDYSKIRKSLTHPMVFDAKNYLDGEKLRRLGFAYRALGRGQIAQVKS